MESLPKRALTAKLQTIVELFVSHVEDSSILKFSSSLKQHNLIPVNLLLRNHPEDYCLSWNLKKREMVFPQDTKTGSENWTRLP